MGLATEGHILSKINGAVLKDLVGPTVTLDSSEDESNQSPRLPQSILCGPCAHKAGTLSCPSTPGQGLRSFQSSAIEKNFGRCKVRLALVSASPREAALTLSASMTGIMFPGFD